MPVLLASMRRLQAACCPGCSAWAACVQGGVVFYLRAVDPNGRSTLTALPPNAPLVLPAEGSATFAVEYRLVSANDTEVDDLALWLGAPAHIQLARHPVAGAVLPDALLHLHGLMGSAQQPQVVAPRMREDPHFRFGSINVNVPIDSERPGRYTLFTTVRRAGASSRAGLLVFSHTFDCVRETPREHRTQ